MPRPESCVMPVGGFAGWAPGAILWDMPIYAGVGLVCLFVPGVTKGNPKGVYRCGGCGWGRTPFGVLADFRPGCPCVLFSRCARFRCWEGVLGVEVAGGGDELRS